MRLLTHPPASDITVEGILHALADPIRAQIFVEIARANCPKTCSTFLEVSEKSVPKSTLSQHFKVLREAGLIRSERKGVEMYNMSRCEDLDERFGELIRAIITAYTKQYQQGQLADNTSSVPTKQAV
jgi:DNA-binding transcriptional ArsR family regulator